MLREESGFTALELVATGVVIIVLAVTSYFYGRSTVHNSKVSPPATSPPTTLTISRATELNTTDTGFTLRVDNTQVAGNILQAIKNLPLVGNGVNNCPNDKGDIYTLEFTDPDEIYSADYGGCYFVKKSGSGKAQSAVQSSSVGSTFWSELQKATNRPL